MKIFRYADSSGSAHTAVKTENGAFELPFTVNEIISGKAPRQIGLLSAQPLDETGLRFLPPVEAPGKILCVGLNYYDHRKECDDFPDAPKEPVLFSKFSNALAAHDEDIPLSPAAVQYDYEAELVIVIGRTAKNVSETDAPDYIFGYTAGNDLSARDLQFRSGQWLIGKSMDKFAPMGPYLVTADEINANGLDISCSLNGELRQSANTRDMIFDPAAIVSYASGLMTLGPGDVIFTGTPGGVILGMPEDKKRWIRAGDAVEVTIEGIGTLRNKFTR